MIDRLQRLKVSVYFADHWESYAELIPEELLIQTKRETHGIERNNFRQRHWFGRFRRKTCIVSRSAEMVDLTMGLFAKFHVNGAFNQILQMFGRIIINATLSIIFFYDGFYGFSKKSKRKNLLILRIVLPYWPYTANRLIFILMQ